MPATRGKRTVIPTAKPEKATAGTYVCGHKPLKFGEYTLTEGVEVPNAENWPRIEAWVNARRVRRLEPGEIFTRFDMFTEGAAQAEE